METPDPTEIVRRAQQSAQPFLADLFFALGKLLMLRAMVWALGLLCWVVWAGYEGLEWEVTGGVGVGWMVVGGLFAWRMARCPRCERCVWALPPLQRPAQWFGFPKVCPHCGLAQRAHSEK